MLCTVLGGFYMKIIIIQNMMDLKKTICFLQYLRYPVWHFFYFGSNTEYIYLLYIGLGILCYGIAYFIIHDVLIHQRFKWFKNTNNAYLKGLRKAHKIHHKNMGKKDSQCFGMLFVPFKYFKKPKLN